MSHTKLVERQVQLWQQEPFKVQEFHHGRTPFQEEVYEKISHALGRKASFNDRGRKEEWPGCGYRKMWNFGLWHYPTTMEAILKVLAEYPEAHLTDSGRISCAPYRGHEDTVAAPGLKSKKLSSHAKRVIQAVNEFASPFVGTQQSNYWQDVSQYHYIPESGEWPHPRIGKLSGNLIWVIVWPRMDQRPPKAVHPMVLAERVLEEDAIITHSRYVEEVEHGLTLNAFIRIFVPA